MGILLAFRTSQACTRFWHGREVWAKVVNKVRSFARALIYLDNPPAAYMDTYFRWLKAYPVCLKQHLRGERNVADLKMLTDSERSFIDTCDNLPVGCTSALSVLLNKVKDDKQQNGGELLWWQLEGALLFELMNAIGEGEAIAGTPVPLSYSRHTSRLTSLWTFCMPLVLVTCLPVAVVPVVTGLVSWTLLATEEISHLIEEPFGLHDDRPNMLPLSRYCSVIESDLDAIRGSFEGLKAYAAQVSDDTYTPLYDAPDDGPPPIDAILNS